MAGTEGALSALDQRAIEALPVDELWIPFAWMYSLACNLTANSERARAFATILRPYADLFLVDHYSFFFLGSVHHHLGLLCATAGERDEAAHHLRAALAEYERLEAPTWIQLTQEALHATDAHRHR
jgi:hypothetical protein